ADRIRNSASASPGGACGCRYGFSKGAARSWLFLLFEDYRPAIYAISRRQSLLFLHRHGCIPAMNCLECPQMQHKTADDFDRKILRELQADARITNNELAERIGLSPSPCLRRVRRLEEAGVIRGYTALVDPA